MIVKQQTEFIQFASGDARYVFLPSGDVREFTNKHFMVNQFVGVPMEASANNIYMKVRKADGTVTVSPLLGCKSKSTLAVAENTLIYTGSAEGIEYKVTFACAGSVWFWKTELSGNGEEVQLVYGQDLGVGDRNGVRTNELYLSQYLDHFVAEGELGYTICSRQNQSQGGQFPYVQQGCLNQKIIGYSTDEMQFFGKEFRKDQRIAALYGEELKEKYQYELSYIALWSEWLTLDSVKEATFYGIFKENLDTPVRGAMYMEEVQKAYDSIAWGQEAEPVKAFAHSEEFGEPVASAELTAEEIEKYFPQRILTEEENGELLSFFQPDHTHVVLQKKERIVERPHGNIITSLPEEKTIRKDLMTSTNFMYGLFNAQTTIGNTDSNRLLSANRGLLNLQKYTGQRVWVKLDGQYHVLTLPAAYEAGLNYSRWYYKLADDMLVIDAVAAADEAAIRLNAFSVNGRSYEFIVTSQLSMGGAEFADDIVLETEGSAVTVTPVETSPIKNHYPNLTYRFTFPEQAVISDDRIFYKDGQTRNGTMLTAAFAGETFAVVMSGTLDGVFKAEQEVTERQAMEELPKKELTKYLAFYNAFKCGFHLTFADDTQAGEAEKNSVEKLNVLTTWYIHNAFVHFYVPRGLEQCSGAAWGTRDVCQGPMELFLTTGHFELARQTLLDIFAHQYIDTKEWPQWFMFDNYPYMAGDCHGDVIFWPLKCIGDYLEYTKDTSILQERVVYRHLNGTYAPEETIASHVLTALEAVKERFVGKTALISYAGGDWDDTLQPADPKMKSRLVSAWTQALAYQALRQLSAWLLKVEDEALKAAGKEWEALTDRIREDFNKFLIGDGVIAGFGYVEDNDKISFMLHPQDEKTGLSYRLLPLTRSIISNLADNAQADRNVKVIDEHLTFPDGVRLMDRPARYDGGVSVFFQRAEQASNVGREISLQYVHAHIRYIEAMSVYGDGNKVFDSLMKIVPINIKEAVPNAVRRQSNAYFSSSEGNYKDRYEYAERFEELRTGEREVKGGWRIYSSGPGIFLGRLIGNMLGIRCKADSIELDPVLPKKLDGLIFEYECFGEKFNFHYHVSGNGAGVEKVTCGGKEIPFTQGMNPYRKGGAVITKECMTLNTENNKDVHIFTN